MYTKYSLYLNSTLTEHKKALSEKLLIYTNALETQEKAIQKISQRLDNLTLNSHFQKKVSLEKAMSFKKLINERNMAQLPVLQVSESDEANVGNEGLVQF